MGTNSYFMSIKWNLNCFEHSLAYPKYSVSYNDPIRLPINKGRKKVEG